MLFAFGKVNELLADEVTYSFTTPAPFVIWKDRSQQKIYIDVPWMTSLHLPVTKPDDHTFKLGNPAIHRYFRILARDSFWNSLKKPSIQELGLGLRLGLGLEIDLDG